MILHRLIFRLGGMVLVLLAAWLGALQSRPVSYPIGFTEVAPDVTCNPPCVMGIQPGTTTATEAVRVLAAHPMVAEVTEREIVGDKVRISWRWRQDVAPFTGIDDSFFVYGDEGIVRSLHIKTAMRPEWFRLLLASPDVTYRIFTDNREFAHVIHTHSAGHFDVYYGFDCILRLASGTEFVTRDSTSPRYYATVPSGYAIDPCGEF